MGRLKEKDGDGSSSSAGSSPRTTAAKSFPSPASSSSSDFEFTVYLSPASKQRSAAQLCPADELFYKGQLLPLQLSPRISMVRTLLLSSASTSSASDTTSTSRDSNGSTSSSFSTDCLLPDSCASSSRPSSAADDELHQVPNAPSNLNTANQTGHTNVKRSGKYFSSFATRFSSVFLHRGGSSKKAQERPTPAPSSSSKSLAKEVIKKYARKVKPFYEKLSHLQQKQQQQNNNQQQQPSFKKPFSFSIRKEKLLKKRSNGGCAADDGDEHMIKYAHSNSFSGNLRFPRQKRCAASCPSSMRSSPSHSGLLSIGGAGGAGFPDVAPVSAIGPVSLSTASSMEELQSAIEGAIAHCKSSMSIAVNQRKVASVVAMAASASGGADEICAF